MQRNSSLYDSMSAELNRWQDDKPNLKIVLKKPQNSCYRVFKAVVASLLNKPKIKL